MVGVPDYDAYVAHRRANRPGLPIMTSTEFFRERQDARYAVGKGRVPRLLLKGGLGLWHDGDGVMQLGNSYHVPVRLCPRKAIMSP